MITNQLFNPKLGSKQISVPRQESRACCFYPRRLIICYDFIRRIPIPLKAVHYFLKVQPGFLVVELKQTYSTQSYQEPIELEYLFSINKNAAVTKMIVELGDTKVYGIVKEKEEAKQEYEEGIKQGKTMAYSEQDEQFPEIKRVKIGALAPKKELQITFEYIQPLDVFLNKLWKVEVQPMVDENYFTLNKQQQTQNLYYERLNRYIYKFVQIDQFVYNFKQDISISIDIGSPITYYKCPTHKVLSGNAKDEYVKEKMNEENFKKLYLMLEDTPSNFIPTKQFTLLFSSDDVNLPRAFLSHTNNDALFAQKYCATLTFIPKFNQTTLDDAYSQYLEELNIAENQAINRGTYLFFIDRSGSMSGGRIKKAKQSLILFLRSLPDNCRFNIISFGTMFRSLWSDSKQYSQDTLDEAIKHVNTMEANMQGTEIFKPFQDVIYNNQYGKSKTTTLNVFLLTDGEVDAFPIIDLVKRNNKAETRIYTLGIGEGCSQYLIKNLAEVGNGKYQFVADDEDINAKVIDLLEDSMTPYLQGFNLESNISSIAQIIPNPESIVCLKKNQELTIQVLFSVDQVTDNLQLTLSCFDPQEQKPIKYSVSLNINQSQENEYFHKLASHKFITYYENSLNYGENHVNFIKINKDTIDDQDIINTSITHQILSSKTAFVCEVCDLEDQFKQQMKQKVYITQIKQNNLIDQQLIGLQRFVPCSANLNRPTSTKGCVQRQTQSQISQQPQIQHCLKQEEEKQSTKPQFRMELMKFKGQKEKMSFDSKKQTQQLMEEQRTVLERYQKEEESCQIEQQNQFQQFQSQINKMEYDQLISYAKADGGFLFDELVEKQINFEGWKNEQSYPQNIWLTLLALIYLDQFCSQNRKSWQLVYQKGVQFLQRNGVSYKQLKEQLLQNIKQQI
ncbi:unnamed protein product [Paramecium octaurelia]|uniref:Uncharacterized protein n=1 Tax=Paramecium octaurelia TaxID=43137 RepID=A0A8S1UD90_PAROT|nr:unnamed protein product [Paramecium octaurelia]